MFIRSVLLHVIVKLDDNIYFQGTVLIKTAQELLDYSKGEEIQVEEVSLKHLIYVMFSIIEELYICTQ